MPQRSYKFRLYPTREQENQLAIDFGCGRYVWNWALRKKQDHWNIRKETLNFARLSRELTWLMDEPGMDWLRDTSRTVTTQKLRDLDQAYQNFFAGRAKFPRFKKKVHAQSVRYQIDPRAKMYDRDTQTLKLPKLGKLKAVWSREFLGTPKMATVSRDAAGRYFVSLSVEETIQKLPIANQYAGLDAGVKDLIVTSDGWKSGNLRPLSLRLRQLKHQQRSLSRKERGSNRWKQQRLRVARLHAKVADTRKNYLQKLSSRLVNENQVIVVEDLNLKGMTRNHRLARVLGDASLGELRRQLRYKSQWYGRTYHEIDRWFPSSKTCSGCGHVIDELNLSVREWDCPKCQSHHDRDINAARNILIEGLKQLVPGGAGELRCVEPGKTRRTKAKANVAAAGDEARIRSTHEPLTGSGASG